MKIWLGDKANSNSGGMYRVYDGLYKYLPQQGIEIVPSKEEADVLNPHIGLWGDFPGDKPVVLSSHGMLWDTHGWGKLAHKVNAECLAAYRRADVVTAPSKFVARSIARYTGASPVVAHHGINTDEWLPGESKGYVLWNKTRADSASNPAEMNELASLAKDTTFYSTLGKEADNVFLFGRISPDDMREMVAQAGVYLALSQESGGPCFGVLEAMSSGVPVLSWNFGGTAEVVLHKDTGYLAQPNNYDDLLEGLRYCQEHRARLGANAREFVINNFQWKDTIFGYIEAYEKALYGWNNKVSVIIPCYNLGRFLPYCLDSVLEQTYPQLEIIVIDDASTDNSWEIIQEYAKRDVRIIPIRHDTNRHVSQARNTGVSFSTGTFILPLDADDRLYPNSIELLVNELKQKREFDIATGHLHIYHETALDGPYQESGWPNNAELKLQLEGYNRLPYASLYRRKVFDRVGGYRTRIRNGVEDADFWTRALSLGYKASILNAPILRYTHREVSLGKTNPHGSDAWLPWFPYKEEDSPATAVNVKNFDPPKVSIVVPVGPGHQKYIQACLDSVWAQTEIDWEVVLVNDTGELLENIPGYVKYVTYPKNMGVAYARNRGIEAASSDKIVFLDVDDTLQSGALHALLLAHEYAGGWIYGDWYINKGEGSAEYSEAENWDYNLILNRSICPITGLYEKAHIQLVGGFNEQLAGWEDWDFHLRLLHHGICGTRLKFPLITYNMHLGRRREENFRDRENLLKYIRETHYTVLKEKRMSCSGCGGKRTLTITNTPKSDSAPLDELVKLEYLGNVAGRQRITSRVHKGTEYKFSSSHREFNIFRGDLEHMLSHRLPGANTPEFKVIKAPPKETLPATIQEIPLVSQEVPEKFKAPETVDALPLEEHIIAKLRKGGFMTITQLNRAEDSELLKVKGIGAQRVAELRKVLAEWTS